MNYFDDYKVGDIIKTGGRTITEADIVNFCMFSGDWYPLHCDVEFVKTTPFGERIAHGLLVLSATSGLIPLREMAIIAFYGMDKVRFRVPTKIGDTLRLEITVLDKEEKGPGNGLITFESKVKNQRGEDAAVSILKIMLAKRSD